jgi:UDP-sulfoquinovose synthase
MEVHNANCTCWNCPAIDLTGRVDFSAGGQTIDMHAHNTGGDGESNNVAKCKRRPELRHYDPMTITFDKCPEWQMTDYGYLLKNMRVMILGIDGYLGWTLALWLGSLGCRVSGVDNYARRDWVMERGAHTIVPITRMTERLRTAREVLGIDIEFRNIDILNQRNLMQEFIDEVKPEAIVHYGECPSAPYSMIDLDHASYVQHNNVLGTLGILFMMRDLVPKTSMIKLGTMGEYGTPLSGRPLFEGMFPDDAMLKWGDREWSLGGEITPRDPGSFYHISKVQDTVNIHKACRFWGLRSYDVMQGVIYGLHTPQVAADPRLRTRLDMDEYFGTVINRFVAQAVIGFPLTIYGSGEQIRGFIALEDAMQCMTRLIGHPPEPGRYEVVNQMSGFYSLRHLAEAVAKVASKEFSIPVAIQRVEDPRVEADIHPYEPVCDKLPDQLGFKPQVNLEQEIYRMLDLLIQPHIKERIEEKQHLILPRTWWSGQKKQVKTLEVVEEKKCEPDVTKYRK